MLEINVCTKWIINPLFKTSDIQNSDIFQVLLSLYLLLLTSAHFSPI